MRCLALGTNQNIRILWEVALRAHCPSSGAVPNRLFTHGRGHSLSTQALQDLQLFRVPLPISQ